MPGSTHSASQLLQSLALVYIRTDKAGVVQEWSAAATSATGIDPASAINRSAADILSPPSEVRAAIADAVAGKLTHGLEVCLGEKLRGDAAARVDSMRLLLQVAPDEDGGGGVMLVGQDISKVKGRDGAMNITKTRFMMDMSHEMRTPLNVITGMTDLILETHLEQEQRMFAEQIQASAEGLLVLINDIIDLTEIEAGTLELKAVDFDIRSALEDAIDTVAISGNSKGLEICGYIDPKLRTHVHGDVDRLRQILVYLMANGVKHNKMGGVYITVRLHEEHADRVAFQFESRDTGSGISPDHVAALFDMEKFTKVRRSQEGEHSVERFQSRLGLYMANYLCRLMQGEMTCTSTLGQGTTISFTAVFAKSRWSSDVAAAAGGARLMVPASLQGKKAIIVTDNAFLRETMEANVTAFGLQSAVAPSIAAAEALGPADVLIVSPAPSAISSLQRAEDPAGGEGGVGTDLEVHMKELASRPVQCPTILLCPISQLGHVVSLRKQCGAECTVASRPTRIGNLLSVLVHTLEAGMQNKWIPWMFHTSSASAVAGDKEADVDEDEDDGLIGASGAERPKGMRMLLALSAEVKDSVRSLFVKIGNACDLCLSANEVRVMVTDTDELLLYDSVVLDHQLLGKNTIQIIKDLHLYQRRQTVPKRLILIAIINKADTACEAALWGAGVDAVVCHPVDEINLQHALANAAANASIRLNQLLKLDMGGSGSASAIGTPVALREATAPPITPWSSEPADDGMKRVVVVDEDAIRQRVIKSYLTKDGFEVTLVKDAPAALEVLDSALCHLILLHVVPAGSGEAPAIGLVPELLRKAAGAGGRVPPIIGVLDAEASAEEEAEYAAAGIGGTLIKPIIKDSLLQMAHKLLERAECARSTALPVGMGAVGEASNKVLRILAADGDGGQRLMLKSMLSRDKHFVDVAENGADAVKLASKNHYDVILLDCYMPVTNGWEASREIRKREFERGLQVAAIIIGISVAKTSEDAENVRTSGLTNLLYRPITRESLRACIAASLTQPSTPSLPPPPTAAGFSRVQSHNVQLHNPAGSPSPSPVSTAPATPVSASPAAAQEKNVAPLVAGGGRVVICDPENGQRLILKKLLNKFGREVAAVSNAEDVMAEVAKGGAAAVFIPTQMPGQSGWELLEKLRQDDRLEHLPIVAICATGTTKESFEAENKAMQAKLDAGGRRNGKAFAASIDKPFNVAVVEKLLAQLTSQSAPAGEEDGKDKKEKSVAKSVARESSSKIVAREGSQKRVLRILVVEDHWANQKLLEAMLKQHGHEVRCCENGMEAVNLTSSVEFDLILMDCNMPVLDGFEATIKIRARQGLNERVAIIAVTANAMTGDRDKCMSAGMDDYITKPVQRQKLHALIAKWTGVDSSTPVRTMGDSPKDRFGRARPDSSHPGMAPSEVPSGGGSTPTGRSTPTPRSPRRGPNQQAQVQRAGAAGGAGAVKPRILLVDDDNTLRLLVKSRLQKDNSIVIDAGDGEEALVKFKQSKPDIVISDVFMPKMDGFELCRQIRKLDKSIPIVMLTSMNDVQDRIKGLDAGADDYIVKPFAPKELEARVRSLLRRSQGSTASSKQSLNSKLSTDNLASGALVVADNESSASVVSKVQELDRLIGMFNQHVAKIKVAL